MTLRRDCKEIKKFWKTEFVPFLYDKNNEDFLDEAEAKNARENAQNIDGPAKHIFMELSGVYEEMAGIKYKAATAANIGKGYDWSHYKVLEERRDQLKEQIKHSKRKQ